MLFCRVCFLPFLILSLAAGVVSARTPRQHSPQFAASVLFDDAGFQHNPVCPGGVRRGLNLCPWSGERLTGRRLDSSQYAIIHSLFIPPVHTHLSARGATRKELRHEAAQLVEGKAPPRATGPPGRASPRVLLG
jgi:hypothetical protein